MARKRAAYTRKVHLGSEAGCTLCEITRAEYKTKSDSKKIKDLIRLFTEYYLSKRNTYHNRGDFFCTKETGKETPEDFWRRVIEIDKESSLDRISAEELLISKYMTAITVKKQRDKMTKENTFEMKKINELVEQNTYERQNKKNTIPEALITTKEEQAKK